MFAATLIFLTIIFKLTKNNKQLAYVVFICGNLIILASHFTLQINWFDYLPIPLASYFSMQHGTIFPLLPFSGYILIGSSLGYLLQNVSAEARNSFIIKKFFLIGLPYVIFGVLFDIWYANGGVNIIGSSPIQLGVSIYRVGLSMWIISVSAFLSKFLTVLQPLLSMLSKRSLFIYVIHLLIIYGSPISPGIRHFFFNVDVGTAFYCALFVIFFSILLVYMYDTSSKNENASNFYKYVMVALIIYMLLI
ncbi:hypothetical protein SDC9_121036 [bioreactor metagenome]|uniref:Heparan-alpha-glucosaminide N-acetyltransferase catalytic domain-containing protein n=1 Tax=bioreactor metagenome TaxID=1076179 RepID=A0A645CAT8_9ZZZZ